MRIICEGTNKRAQGLAAALSYEHQLIMWDKAKKNPYDMWDEVQPGLVIAHQETLDKYDELFACKKFPIEKIKASANSAQMLGGVYNNVYKSKYAYFSDVDPKTNPLIINVLASLSDLHLRIYGPFYIHLPNYVGKVSLKEMSHILKSVDSIVAFDEDWALNAAMVGKPVILNGELKVLPPVLETNTYIHQAVEILTNLGIETKLLDKAKDIAEKYKS